MERLTVGLRWCFETPKMLVSPSPLYVYKGRHTNPTRWPSGLWPCPIHWQSIFLPEIPALSAHTAHKTLGHFKDPSGNQVKQYKKMKAKSGKVGIFVRCSMLDQSEAWVYYFSIFLTSVCHALPNCFFTLKEFWMPFNGKLFAPSLPSADQQPAQSRRIRCSTLAKSPRWVYHDGYHHQWEIQTKRDNPPQLLPRIFAILTIADLTTADGINAVRKSGSLDHFNQATSAKPQKTVCNLW